MKKEFFVIVILMLTVAIGKAQLGTIWYEPDTITIFIDYQPMKTDFFPSERLVYTYDENAIRTKEVKQIWDYESEQFQDRYQYVYGYHANGKIETILFQTWNEYMNQWDNESLTTYTYNENDLLEIDLQSNWDDETLTFVPSMRGVYEYNEQGNEISMTGQQWSDANQEWVSFNTLLHDYVYDENGNILFTKEFWLNAADTNYYAYFYDENNYLTSETFDYTYQGTRRKSDSTIYVYDEHYNLFQRISKRWNEDSLAYIHANWDGRLTYTYDENQNLVRRVRDTYNYNIGVWEIETWNPRLDWTYENNNAILIEAFEFYNDEWVSTMSSHAYVFYNNMKSFFEVQDGGNLFEISYTTFETPSQIRALEMMEIHCYPNPTQDNIYITGLTEHSFVSIYDINGQRIASQQIFTQHATFDMSAYQSGIYFIEIKNNTQKYTKKIVKQ